MSFTAPSRFALAISVLTTSGGTTQPALLRDEQGLGNLVRRATDLRCSVGELAKDGAQVQHVRVQAPVAREGGGAVGEFRDRFGKGAPHHAQERGIDIEGMYLEGKPRQGGRHEATVLECPELVEAVGHENGKRHGSQTKGGVGEVRTELHRHVESLPTALSDLEPLHQHDIAQRADRLREGPVLLAPEIVSRAERHIERDYARLRPGEPAQELDVVATSPALGHVAQGAMSGWRFIHPQIRARGCR